MSKSKHTQIHTNRGRCWGKKDSALTQQNAKFHTFDPNKHALEEMHQRLNVSQDFHPFLTKTHINIVFSAPEEKQDNDAGSVATASDH